MEWLLLMTVLNGASRAQRHAVLGQLLPLAIPGSSSQRLAFAAITAEEQVRRAAVQDRNLIEEVVATTEVDDAAELQQRFPEVYARFTALRPELQAQIFPRPNALGAQRAAAAGDGNAVPPPPDRPQAPPQAH